MALTPELQAKLAGVANLPSPPSVAMKIVELAEQPEPDMAAVARVISMDSALTSKILRIANSALYARRRRSENLRQALIVLGLNATMTLALSFSLATSLRRDRPATLDYTLYWKRTLLAAMTARTLGAKLERFDSEELFLAALLQDIGMLVIDRVCPEAYDQGSDAQRLHDGLPARERSTLGADHVEVGAWLLDSWKMPDFLHIAVANSHDPDALPADHQYGSFTRCVALSGVLADLWLNGEKEPYYHAAAELAERLFNFDRAAVSDVLGMVREQIPETEALFDTDVMAAGESELILDRAREVLLVRNLQVLHEVSSLRETAESLENRAQELEEVSRRDKLTGTFNRAYLDEKLREEFLAAKSNGWPLSVLFADLDRFKLVNDTFGHQAGDRVLKKAAELLDDCTRDSDIVARYGGEEFVVILPGNTREKSVVVAKRILTAFQQTKHALGDGPGHTVTVSVGLATLDARTSFETVETLIEAADKAVYDAKVRGRNRLVVDGESKDEEPASGAARRA